MLVANKGMMTVGGGDGALQPLRIEGEGGVTVSMVAVGSPDPVDLEYSVDEGDTWDVWDAETGATAVTFASDGDSVMFRAGANGNASMSGSNTEYHKFVITGGTLYYASGTPMSLISQDIPGEFPSGVGDWAFAHLFDGCSGLNIVNGDPLVLPATELRGGCYHSMFRGCTSLTLAPALPAVDVPEFAYVSMFEGCTALVNPGLMNASSCGTSSFASMFAGCTSLQYVPSNEDGVATFCESSSYGSHASMFEGCTSLKTAPVTLYGSHDGCCTNMFKGCSSLMSVWGINGGAYGIAAEAFYGTFEGCTSLDPLDNFNLYYTDAVAQDCCRRMFYGCTALTRATDFIPRATTLADGCYREMFYGCTSLTSAPSLPATTLADHCYYAMFQGCTSLTAAPSLPATTLTRQCYYSMFQRCVQLASAISLPATTLAPECYAYMFVGCVRITSATIAASDLTTADNCCFAMFSGCSRLSSVTTNQLSFSNCGGWMIGVASSGTFTCSPQLGDNSTITRGTSACPANWTVVNA